MKTNLCTHKENSYVYNQTQKQFFQLKIFATVTHQTKIQKLYDNLQKVNKDFSTAQPLKKLCACKEHSYLYNHIQKQTKILKITFRHHSE